MSTVLEIRKHVRFFARHLDICPSAYNSLDSTRLTLLFFAVSGLDILNELDNILTKEQKKGFIDWIYSLQCTPSQGYSAGKIGFRGSHFCAPAHTEGLAIAKENFVFTDSLGIRRVSNQLYDYPNLAQTYSGLLSLVILGDDLSRVERAGILNAVKLAQRPDGCFLAQGPNSESDMRFVFCAVAICYILGETDCIDWPRLAKFIKSCVSYDGGIGQSPGDEAHGGSTYCAVAALSLAGRLWDESVFGRQDIDRLIKWCLFKQTKGFHGRAGKVDDTCYAFWIGGTLKILNASHLCSQELVRDFLLSAQHNHMGGFSKLQEPGAHSDILHTYFSLAALALSNEPFLRPVSASLNVSERAHSLIRRMQQQSIQAGNRPPHQARNHASDLAALKLSD